MVKPDPKLSDMPPHIKHSIVDDLDTETKLSLRDINKQFKEVVKNSKIHYEKLKMSLSADKVELVWQKTKEETVKLLFKPKEDGFEMIKGAHPVKTGKGDYRKAAVAKLFSVFKNSKVSVGKLNFRIVCGTTGGDARIYGQQQIEAERAAIFEEIGRILPLKNFRLKIGKLDIFPLHKAELMSVLPHLEPGILKTLRVTGCDLTTTPAFDDQLIVDTDQWRQLEEVGISAFKLDIPFEMYSHFKIVGLRLTARSTGTMKTLLEKVLQTPTMNMCWLRFPEPNVLDMTGAKEYVDQFEKIEGPGSETYIKNPYEAGKTVNISIMVSEILNVQK